MRFLTEREFGAKALFDILGIADRDSLQLFRYFMVKCSPIHSSSLPPGLDSLLTRFNEVKNATSLYEMILSQANLNASSLYIDASTVPDSTAEASLDGKQKQCDNVTPSPNSASTDTATKAQKSSNSTMSGRSEPAMEVAADGEQKQPESMASSPDSGDKDTVMRGKQARRPENRASDTSRIPSSLTRCAQAHQADGLVTSATSSSAAEVVSGEEHKQTGSVVETSVLSKDVDGISDGTQSQQTYAPGPFAASEFATDAIADRRQSQTTRVASSMSSMDSVTHANHSATHQVVKGTAPNSDHGSALDQHQQRSHASVTVSTGTMVRPAVSTASELKETVSKDREAALSTDCVPQATKSTDSKSQMNNRGTSSPENQRGAISKSITSDSSVATHSTTGEQHDKRQGVDTSLTPSYDVLPACGTPKTSELPSTISKSNSKPESLKSASGTTHESEDSKSKISTSAPTEDGIFVSNANALGQTPDNSQDNSPGQKVQCGKSSSNSTANERSTSATSQAQRAASVAAETHETISPAVDTETPNLTEPVATSTAVGEKVVYKICSPEVRRLFLFIRMWLEFDKASASCLVRT